MAQQSSRDIALERRKALSTSGKKASSISVSNPDRVRTAADINVAKKDVVAVMPNSNETHTRTHVSKTVNHSPRRTKVVSNPSRELVLARREALSLRGKSANNSKDRTRVEVEKSTPNPSLNSVVDTTSQACCEPCAQKALEDARNLSTKSENTLRKSGSVRRKSTTKRRVIENTSRALVLARREALSKHGKSAAKQPTTAAAVARQGNPDLTSREISQRVRELRSKSGATGKERSCGTRPCGPNRNASKQNALVADAHWKVGISETTSGQLVTGTQANRSIKTTGNEASTCRSITGTQYLGNETIQAFCESAPAYKQPLKVGVTSTTHGNQVTGNEVGRSEKVTGDEPGTCKNLTGTEYLSANQSSAYCNSTNVLQSPRKVGLSLTQEGRKVSGVMVGRTGSVTGNEAGASRQLTGDQYLGKDPLPDGRPAEKVGSYNTLKGTSLTGTGVGRAKLVTGDEHGSCKNVTGDEYVGSQHFDSFCSNKPQPEASKVGLSLTNKSQTVSGTMTGRSALVTGDEPGTCKAVTGTPYTGLEVSGQLCESSALDEIKKRTPNHIGTPGPSMTGIQPGVGGVMTGADKGACEVLTGTPYVGVDQFSNACGVSPYQGDANSLGDPGTGFTVQSPARAAQSNRESQSGVTGISYEQGTRITGPFDMAGNKVTGTENFRFDQNHRNFKQVAVDESVKTESEGRPGSRITGEGQSAGLNITGDDWARGERVTGTEGTSARRRNPSRPGTMTAMQPFEPKRNEEMAKPELLITGSSGNTAQGQLVTFSGGARG